MLDSRQNLTEPLTAERFYDVVERLQFKGGHGVIFVSSGKNNFRIMADPFQDLQAGQAWHPHIQEDEIRAQFINETYRAMAVSGFTNDFQPGFTKEEVLDCLPGQRLVLNYHRSNWES